MDFDLLVLLAACLGYFFSTEKKLSLVIIINFMLFNLVYSFDWRTFGDYFYLIAIAIDLTSLMLITELGIKKGSLALGVFIASIIFNGVIFIDKGIGHHELNSNYGVVMQVLTTLLIINIYNTSSLVVKIKEGLKHVYYRHHSDRNRFDSRRLQDRGVS